MIQIVNPLVRSLSPLSNEISWEIKNTTEDAWEYTFQIFRSESQAGPWDFITEPFTDRYYFIDTRIPKYRHTRKLFYKIRVTRRSDSKEVDSFPFSVEGPSNRFSEKISSLERLAFRKYAGQRILVLPIKTFGFRCSCWDKITGRRLGGDCKQCYNTGFVGGYMNGVETYANIQADPSKINPAQGQETEPKANNIILTNYPLVKPYDLIIQPDLNLRWRVAVVAPTRVGGAIVHQNLTVSGVSPSDIEQNIKIDDTVLQKSRPEKLSKIRTTV